MKRTLSLILTLVLILTFMPRNTLFVHATNDLNVSLSAEDETIFIQFDSNGGTSISPIETLPNEAITLPSEAPFKSGYNFVGWATSKNGDAEYKQNDAFCADESTTLYAQWDKLCDPYTYEDCYYCSGAGEVYSHSIYCSTCGGDGLSSLRCYTCSGAGKIPCSLCDGTGKNECSWCDGTGDSEYTYNTCTACGGSGEICSVGVCNTCSRIMGVTVRDYDGSCQRAGHSVWTTCTRCSKCGGDGKIPEACYRCAGAGIDMCVLCDGAGKYYCYTCNGAGKYYCYTCDGDGQKKVYKACDNCAGGGKTQIICSICDGTGTVIRKSVSTPSAPVVLSYDETIVTLQEISNGEYSIDGVNWQESPTFEGLIGGTEYTFYQRHAKTDTTLRSSISTGLTVTAQHVYDNDCDAICNVCEYIRDITHNYVIVVTKPTCTEQGYTTYTCNMCGDSYNDDYVDATGHQYNSLFDFTCNSCYNYRNEVGDVNNDGKINTRDAALLMQYCNEWDVKINGSYSSDVNRDGKINTRDAAALIQYCNGWDV